MLANPTTHVYPDKLALTDELLDALRGPFPEAVSCLLAAGCREATLVGWRPAVDAPPDKAYWHLLLFPESLLPPRPAEKGQVRETNGFLLVMGYEGPVLQVETHPERFVRLRQEVKQRGLRPAARRFRTGQHGYIDTVTLTRKGLGRPDDPLLLPYVVADYKGFMAMLRLADGRHLLVDIDEYAPMLYEVPGEDPTAAPG